MLPTVITMEDDQSPIGRHEVAYKVVAERIARRIRAGEWPVHSPLPNEYALAEWYGVSRPTVRSAIQVLVAGGMVEVIGGKGTFVAGSGH